MREIHMSIQYPQEILDQQAKVRQELEKLAKMRTNYLKSTGQMPPSAANNKRESTDEKRAAASPSSEKSKVAVS